MQKIYQHKGISVAAFAVDEGTDHVSADSYTKFDKYYGLEYIKYRIPVLVLAKSVVHAYNLYLSNHVGIRYVV